ncbi:MAG: T9SS type A sorting domain-containing protein, partial [Flavobacteriia bacterium]|nr:T9SS type A sorting domain-containing protein [Flavobacteriia bacterium]
MGGGMGDLSWLEAGDVPMCAVHCPTDPVATYTTGDVSIASIGLVTTDISGSYDVMKKANLLGNNSILDPVNAGSDSYTLAAASASLNAQGMTIANATVIQNQTVGAPVDNVFPYITVNPYEASPWDLWDSTTTVNIALAMGLPAAQGTAAHVSNIAQNPDMGYAKSMAYIDSTLGYFCRRIVRATNLDGLAGINELPNAESVIQMNPNPTSNNITIHSDTTAGKLVKEEANLSSNHVDLNNLNLTEGLYLCSIVVNGQTTTKRLIIR